MKRTYPTAALIAGLASLSPTAFAQTSDWSGFSIGINAGQGMRDDNGGETVVFDTNRDGTFDDTVRTGLGADAKDLVGEAFGDLLGFGLQLGELEGTLLQGLGQLFLLAFRCAYGEAAWQEEVAGITLAHLHHIVGETEVLDVLFEDDFHGRCS